MVAGGRSIASIGVDHSFHEGVYAGKRLLAPTCRELATCLLEAAGRGEELRARIERDATNLKRT
jgi:hypothetical protein